MDALALLQHIFGARNIELFEEPAYEGWDMVATRIAQTHLGKGPNIVQMRPPVGGR